MPCSDLDVSKVPGFPFRVPPPFPGPQLRTLTPATLPNNGTYKMIEARSVPQLNHLSRPQVSLGCAWDPFTREWTISDDDRDLHRRMVESFHYGAGSLLTDYLSSAESFGDVESSDLMINYKAPAQITVKISSKSNLGLRNEDSSIITIGESELLSKSYLGLRNEDSSIITIGESESEDEIASYTELKKDQWKANSDVQSVSENGLLVISSVEEDLIEKILIDLDPVSLKRMETTCSAFRNLIDSKNIWQKLSDRISKSDKQFNFERKKKIAINCSSKHPPRISHKKTLLQLERSCSNLRQGFGYLRECPQLKRGDRWDKIACNEQFISESVHNTVWVMDRRGQGQIRLDFPDEWEIWVIGFVRNILLTYNRALNLISLIQISTDQDLIGDISTIDSIGPIVGGVKGLHLARNYLAVCSHRGRIEIYQISDNGYQPHCEVVIPLGHIVPCGHFLDWPGIDIGGGKVFLSLHNVFKNEAQRFHVDKIEGKIMSIDLDGKYFIRTPAGFIHGLLDPTEGTVSLKYSDGFLYVVTRKMIRVWNHIRKEMVSSKRVDFMPKSTAFSAVDPRGDISVELNDSVLIISCGSVLSMWDRKECEKEAEHLIEKYSGDSSKLCAFARSIMSATDRSLLWKVQLPVLPTSLFLEARKITLLPRFQTECVMVLDFWC